MKRTSQRGFALIELMVAALIATLLAVWASEAMVRRTQEASAEAAAAWMLAVRLSAERYIAHYADSLRQAPQLNDADIEGVAEAQAPSLVELKQQGMLAAAFPESHGRDLQVAVRVLRNGDCPGDECRLDALVYSTRPLDKALAGRSHEGLLAYWLMAAGGRGGLVSYADPGQLKGAAFALPNPPLPGMPVLDSGTVALTVGLGGALSYPWLKVGDTRNPDFGADVAVAGSVVSNQAVRAQGALWLGERAYAGATCPENGLIVREHYGGLLVCRSYQWVSAGGRGGGGYSVNTVSGCVALAANPVTGLCSCPAGYTVVLVADSGPKADAEGRTRGYLCAG
ncbi:type II secretion system protein [Pusillimonas minor]|uniref:Prepilin-type N-terminal cleavage/methylation domain-containing protein n=1 Tax=Pusillimonas minor TaxID=2697024 RepID=A0A842HU19_9BURK|nr:prepilin-type N-terminal cleavage/methylation domain-containing protein [Pusillimonas minor]MBC2770305.1 prepilin-type N-terminal cleavage/methylation domain-containing protein [Pusillimonas minor]